MPLTPSSPLPPFIPAQAFWALPVTISVNHTFHFSSPSTAYTGPVIHCLSRDPSIRHPSSRPVQAQDSLSPPHFTFPLPSTNPPNWHIKPHLLWPIDGLVGEGHSPVIPLMDLRPSRTNPSICIYQPLNQTHSAHLPQCQTWGHMVSSFKFSNKITLSFGTSPWINPIAPIQPMTHVPIACPHKSIPSRRSSQFVRPMALPQKSIPSPRSSRAPPWHAPITQSHCPHPASVAPPWHAPTNQSHLPDPVAHPHDTCP